MMKTAILAAAVATVVGSYAATAQAEDIPATPMNHGPMVMTGMGAMGALGNLALTPVNVLAPPAQQVGLAVTNAVAGPGAPAAEPAPMMKHHRHHHHHMMMMKKKKKM